MNLFKGPSRHDAKISEADAEINKKTWNLMTDRKIVYDYIEPECKECKLKQTGIGLKSKYLRYWSNSDKMIGKLPFLQRHR